MHDLERIGLFKEMTYITTDSPFKDAFVQRFNGKNFIVNGTKIPCGNSDGYFHEFQRIFDAEKGPSNYGDILRKWRLESTLKNLGKHWIPNSGDIKLCGVGSQLGSFNTHIPAFSTPLKSIPSIHEKKNFITNPPQKGSGYGYNNICINKYPEYIMGNKYNDFQSIYQKTNEFHETKVAGRPIFRPPNGCGTYFTENPYLGGNRETRPPPPKKELDKPFIVASYPKKDGGMKAGTLNPFPVHMPSQYLDPPFFMMKEVFNDQGKRFLPNNNFPTFFPTSSILQKNVTFRCNNTNIANVPRVMTY